MPLLKLDHRAEEEDWQSHRHMYKEPFSSVNIKQLTLVVTLLMIFLIFSNVSSNEICQNANPVVATT